MSKMQQEHHGSIDILKQFLEQEKATSIFFVTGKNLYPKSPLKDSFTDLLKDYKVTYFTDYSSNPKLEDVRKGIKICKANECDIIIAFGGGSAMDIAKAINILGQHEEAPEKYITKQLPLTHPGKPLITIPTTSGTGSEATHFAVVYIGKTKYSLAHPELVMPNYTILDPLATLSMPAKVTAATGMDAFCQAIESTLR